MNMNKAISRLFVVVILLVAVLIFWTSRWTVFSAASLDTNPVNPIPTYQSWKIKRGELLADNGSVLAKSVKAGGGTWSRKYPYGSLFAQPVGYGVKSYTATSGLEQYRLPQLKGQQGIFQSVFGNFNGGTRQGDDVQTTLDPKAQKLAQTLLDQDHAVNGAVGSVVAIVPQTGAVKVMYSNPTYNDNDPGKYNTKVVDQHCPNPLRIGCEYNLATEGSLPPGSTFKVVTTTAALNSGEYTPNSVINGDSPKTISGKPLENDDNESWGDITLSDALTNSVNTVYAQVGEKLGANVLQDYMKRFGFYRNPPLDYPAAQMNASGTMQDTKHGYQLVPLTNPINDIGRTAIGQANLLVSPFQMAMVASTVADDGTLMTPRLTTKAVNPDGQVVARWPAKVYHHVMKKSVALEMQQMMRHVVEEGTGTTANLEGLTAAGKTGTASTGGYKDGQPLDDAWFIGFAPADHPKIAVAVMLPNIPNGYGGTYAAPIAAQEMKTLLAEGQ